MKGDVAPQGMVHGGISSHNHQSTPGFSTFLSKISQDCLRILDISMSLGIARQDAESREDILE